jgi:hypothetical protein
MAFGLQAGMSALSVCNPQANLLLSNRHPICLDSGNEGSLTASCKAGLPSDLEIAL